MPLSPEPITLLQSYSFLVDSSSKADWKKIYPELLLGDPFKESQRYRNELALTVYRHGGNKCIAPRKSKREDTLSKRIKMKTCQRQCASPLHNYHIVRE